MGMNISQLLLLFRGGHISTQRVQLVSACLHSRHQPLKAQNVSQTSIPDCARGWLVSRSLSYPRLSPDTTLGHCEHSDGTEKNFGQTHPASAGNNAKPYDTFILHCGERVQRRAHYRLPSLREQMRHQVACEISGVCQERLPYACHEFVTSKGTL
jgi:hypothetical protein